MEQGNSNIIRVEPKKYYTQKTSIIPNPNAKRTRKPVFWSEREEKTLFILQMALGTKFSIIKTFLKNKTVNEIKNHFYSKLRTYLSIQISKLQAEKFFKDIDKSYYTVRKVLSLVLSHKIPTMILYKNVIKDLILEHEEQKKNKSLKMGQKKDGIESDENGDGKKMLKKKRGRPPSKSMNTVNNSKIEKKTKIKGIDNKNKIKGDNSKNKENIKNNFLDD